MKLTFRRWDTSENEETFPAQAISNYGETLNIQSGPIEWCGPNSAIGKIDGVTIDGSYLIRFDFEKAELRSWLKKFIIEDPEYSVQLLAEAHAALLISAENKKNRITTRKKPV